MTFRLDHQVALVIGGTSGIGKAIVEGYREAGAKVLVVGRTPGKLPATDAYLADVCDMAALRALVAKVISDHGRIDILVNSQGITTLKPAEEFTLEDWDEVVGTDLKSVFFACTEVGRHMLARKSGAIVNIASLASYRGWPRSALYALSKSGVMSLTETLAAEWAGRGVRVNAIAPGFVLTDMNRDKMSAERKARALDRTPMARFGETQDLAGAAVFLASPASAFVTGTTIAVDGGFLAAGL
ncbi:MAG TPA: SDR family oxidoreductase [Usitatibacter sp.]|nr:SDR family oxidoreductase [Usitatibacter sp.]